MTNCETERERMMVGDETIAILSKIRKMRVMLEVNDRRRGVYGEGLSVGTCSQKGVCSYR